MKGVDTIMNEQNKSKEEVEKEEREKEQALARAQGEYVVEDPQENESSSGKS